jgi:hypothetical protein
LGPLDKAERSAINQSSDLRKKYEEPLDRESAFEKLRERAQAAAREAEQAQACEDAQENRESQAREFNQARRYDPDNPWGASRKPAKRTSRYRKEESFGEAVAGVVIKELKGTTGRRIVRGLFGSIFKSR